MPSPRPLAGRFAAKTDVAPEKTRLEIEHVLARYGASEFGFSSAPGRATIVFKAHDRFVRFTIPLLAKDDRGVYRRPWDGKSREYNYDTQRRDGKPTLVAVPDRVAEQETRQRWRALLLVVKAKLEAVASGVVEFEQEFLAHIILPPDADGRVRTVGETLVPRIDEIYATGRMPPLLGMGGD